MVESFSVELGSLLEVFFSVFYLSQNEAEVALKMFNLLSKLGLVRFVWSCFVFKYLLCSLAKLSTLLKLAFKEKMLR